jgi:hypothetical protein
LWYPSTQGGTDDRYYRVWTTPARLEAITADVYRYSFECIAIVPYVYDEDGNRVT